MVVWRRPCSDGEITAVKENSVVTNCTLGFFVSRLPSTNAMFKKMKLSSCVVLFIFSVSDSLLLCGKRRGNNMAN